MSSAPFCLGIPVVDSLEACDGSVVLRSRDKDSAIAELLRVRKELTQYDEIKTYFIGYRPDYPVPVSRYFTEVKINLGRWDNKDRPNLCYLFIGDGFWSTVMYGERRVDNEAD